MLVCQGCERELEPRDMREVIVRDEPYGPLCAACAAEIERVALAQWLDETWARQHPH